MKARAAPGGTGRGIKAKVAVRWSERRVEAAGDLQKLGTLRRACARRRQYDQKEREARFQYRALEMIEVTVTVAGQSSTCHNYEKRPDYLCAAYVPYVATEVRIQIAAQGYKPFTINVPSLRFTGGLAHVNIGEIAMMRSDWPDVVRVIQGRGRNGTRVFELTMRNKGHLSLLIKTLDVYAVHTGNGKHCSCCPPLAVYEIANKLIVTGGGKGEVDSGGEYEEKVNGRDFVVPIASTIERSTCNGSVKLRLSLPVSFVIPEDSFSAIRVVLPETFTVTKSRYVHSEKRSDQRKPPIDPSSGQLTQFENFTFTLSTGDELNITAHYP